ncbi:MAG TPA: DUF1801 domain-containing protein [Cyclobacteriaceae bacterium]|nr:DUF1801 domain-containing protein [Cyclobacteriaceae bacterium]HMV08856.1 DUF1801 domain-containing protein [Cyclobacteriaceae bacterium]HMV89162.1 DUF1801 domain-containing protein [Cyclobacteriaceae bacterium]HMX00003.1 DUF1801 domain-containing protein [Cyclobacteriaceae bacterium]HMX49135.1 DUF1801 domain-containing protein [Cyclobacteriaceae bacterium]
MNDSENFYLQQKEPVKSCLLAMRDIILAADPDVTTAWKYGMPFFCYKGKMFCYLWVHKKYKQPYLGIVEGNRFDEPFLIQEKRSRMKIMLLDPVKDLPVRKINFILKKAFSFYKDGTVKIK